MLAGKSPGAAGGIPRAANTTKELPMKKHYLLIAAAFAVLALVSGCKGKNSQNTTDMRSLHAVVDAEPLDVLVDSDVKTSALPFGSTSSYVQFDSGTRDVQVRSTTAQTILSDKQLSFSSGVNNTLVIYGKRAAMQTQVVLDDTVSPSSGHFRVRALNLAPDAGAVDLYVTTGPISSSGGSIVPAASYGALTGAAEVANGSLQVTLTTSGTQDILFQSPAQNFSDNSTYTIVVLPSLSGKLVSAVLLTQGANPSGTLLQNPFARVKAVNAIPDASALNFKADGTVLLSSVPFMGSSNYVTTAAGTHSLQIEASNVPGTIIASLSKALGAATDYSAIAAGSLAAPSLIAIADDNSLPTSGFAKIRFVNAQPGSAAVDVLLNFAAQTTGLPAGSASTYFQVTPSLTYTITFATPGGVTVIATLSPVEIDAGAVYTGYLFGTGSSAQVRLVRDR
jgi:Domain of unknown function (DUF4397)